MYEEDRGSIQGRVRAEDVAPSHSKGFDAALDAALDEAEKLADRLGRRDFRVNVEFAADVLVENPGRIQHYIVTLTPAS